MVNLRDSNGRSLYFSNRKLYYKRIDRESRRQEKLLNVEAGFEFEELFNQKVTRYSVAFMNVRGDYGKTHRAIIIDPQPLSRRARIVGELKEALRNKFMEFGQWGVPTQEAFEKEDIDLIEADGLPRNEIFFEGFE